MRDFWKKYKFLLQTRAFTIFSIIFLIIITSLIFYSRYRPNFAYPNFYGEDGVVYTKMLQDKGYLGALLTPFNGYLIMGLYLVMYAGTLSNHILGGGLFSHLPFHYALASCLFMGTVFSLPYILFRKELGKLASLTIVILSAFVPLKMRDYAVIGTIGNLKFVFVYLAFLLILYRVLHRGDKRPYRSFLIDFTLLISVFTNGGVVLLLPFAFFPYIKETIKDRSPKKSFHKLIRDKTFISLAVITLIAVLYAGLIQLRGVPTLEYLNIPYNHIATPNIINRVTWFAFTYPITNTFTDTISIGTLVLLLAGLIIYRRKDWFVWVLGFFAIASTVLLFLHNRQGIWIWYGGYGHMGGTDEFFYYANLIFYFMLVWVSRERLKRLTIIGTCLFIFGFGLYVTWARPFGMTGETVKSGYPEIGSLMQNLDRECATDNDPVVLNIFPTSDWQMRVDRKTACAGHTIEKANP